jgi:hypothetical protein
MCAKSYLARVDMSTEAHGSTSNRGLSLINNALSEARFQEEVRTSTMVRRVFDKAVRTKPPVVAADAGAMQIQLREGVGSGCAEAVRQSTTDDSGDEKVKKAPNSREEKT